MRGVRRVGLAAMLWLAAVVAAVAEPLYIQLGSYEDETVALRMLNADDARRLGAMLFVGADGAYKLAVGPWERDAARAELTVLKDVGAVPDDSFLTALAGAVPIVSSTFGDETTRREASLGVSGAATALEIAGTGSGFFVDAEHALTNWHVVEGCAALVGADDVPLALVARDVDLDLALLRATEPSAARLAFAADGAVGLGETVYVLGYPLYGLTSRSIALTKGVKSGRYGLLDDPSRFTLTAQIQPGNSGGPVLDERGAVVGVAVARLSEAAIVAATGALPQDVNFAVSGGLARRFAAEAGARLAPPAASAARIGVDGLPAAVEAATIPIACLR